MERPLLIAIDGPAASGKGTLARRLAGHFGLPHLDTGLLYRAVGWAAERTGRPPVELAATLQAADLANPELAADGEDDIEFEDDLEATPLGEDGLLGG